MQKNEILVTAIIITHNRLEFLPRAINSVISQTYSNVECVVVSDNSDDGTDEYCKYRNDITFISITKSESKGGNHARNIGIKVAHGMYVAFLDDDDYWLPEKIEKQLAIAIEKESGFVYCRRYFEWQDAEGTHRYDEDVKECPEGDLSETILTRLVSSTSTFFVKKDLLREVGMFDEKMSMWQDYDLSIMLAQKTHVFCVMEPCAVYWLAPQDKNKITNRFDKVVNSMKYFAVKHRELVSSYPKEVQKIFYMRLIGEVKQRSCKTNISYIKLKYNFLCSLCSQLINLKFIF